jgi:hypothetical protein
MPEQEWTEVAWLEPEGQDNRMADAPAVLDGWLRERGLTRADISDDDVRLDLMYLGPTRGVCGTRICVRTSVIGTRDPL